MPKTIKKSQIPSVLLKGRNLPVLRPARLKSAVHKFRVKSVRKPSKKK